MRRDFDTREAGLLRCRTRGNTQHEHALASSQRQQALIELFVHLNAQRRTDVLTGLDELRDYAHDGVHRHGETNPGRGAGGVIDRRVDADEPSCRIEQRPTGVARVDGGVGLDQVIDGRAARFSG